MAEVQVTVNKRYLVHLPGDNKVFEVKVIELSPTCLNVKLLIGDKKTQWYKHSNLRWLEELPHEVTT